MRASGFNVRTTDLNDLSEIKKSRGVPDQVQSCHTAVVNGYVVEGHVPAADVHRLLKEKPAIAGIAVGGMPVGSPGMDFPGTKAQPYDVDVVRQERRHARVRQTLMNGSVGAAGLVVPRGDRSSARL